MIGERLKGKEDLGALRLRSQIKQVILNFAVLAGRYQPFTEAERECVQREAVPFVGDIPKNAGSEFNQYRVEFKIPRPLQEVVSNLLYTPRGMGYLQKKLYERFSLQETAVQDVLIKTFPHTMTVLPQGTVVQVETPYTYGDWVSEHLACLTRALPICAPLLMPKHLMDKSYVRRDLAQLGIETITVEEPILIQKAVVLHKTRFSHYWTASEAEAYRKAFCINPIQPRSGSILYLSREGEQSESISAHRSYPSKLTADIMKEFGAKVVFARQTTYEDYCALAQEAETVVADHGAAMSNLLLWNTKNVIELFSDQHWTSCFLFLAKALGISNYALLSTDNITHSELRCKLIDHLKSFNVYQK